VAVRAAVNLKFIGSQVMQYPLRGLLLRAGSRHYKYCWATAPYPYFYFFFGWQGLSRGVVKLLFFWYLLLKIFELGACTVVLAGLFTRVVEGYIVSPSCRLVQLGDLGCARSLGFVFVSGQYGF
jgi:hypothetical protein